MSKGMGQELAEARSERGNADGLFEASGGESILVVDDDPFIARLLEIELRAAGYDVRVANDGERGLDLARERCPELVLADVMMPNMDGFELTRHLRMDSRTATVSVIMLTARGLSADKLEGFAVGADDYIVKPFDRDELKARVGAGERIVALEQERARRLRELQDALDHIKTLQGILPICMYCRRIQSDDASWQRIEEYVAEHSNAEFSHGMCPECTAKYHPELLEE